MLLDLLLHWLLSEMLSASLQPCLPLLPLLPLLLLLLLLLLLDASTLLTVATRCLTSAHCRHKHQSWKQGKLNALQVLTDAISRCCQIPDLRQTGHFASARCRHKHQSWSCEKLDALQVLTVAPIINHGAANKQDALQVLTDDTNINHGAAKSWMLYKCWLSHQASIRELRNIG